MVADIWVGAIADAILVGRAADIADGDKRLKRPPPTGGSLFTGPLGIGPKKVP